MSVAMSTSARANYGQHRAAAGARKLDEGCVPEAFEAWCSVFMEKFDVLKGRDGGEWTLLGELNFEVFEATLRGMKRKKSVGVV